MEADETDETSISITIPNVTNPNNVQDICNSTVKQQDFEKDDILQEIDPIIFAPIGDIYSFFHVSYKDNIENFKIIFLWHSILEL